MLIRFRALQYVLLPFAALSVYAQEPCATDVLRPVKGHDLCGTVLAATEEGITFRTDSDIDLRVSWKTVQQLQLRHRIAIHAMHLNGGKGISADAATIDRDGATGSLAIRGGGREETVSAAELLQISTMVSSAPTATWAASIAPKFSLAAGTQSVQTLSGSAAIRRAQNTSETSWNHQETTLTFDANNSLTEQAGSPSIRTHEYDASFAHSVYLFSGVFAEAIAEGFHNSSFDLYLQQSYGGSVGKAFRRRFSSLEIGAGGLYVAEHFTSTPGPSFAAARLREGIGLTLGNLKGGPIRFAETAIYLPALDQKKAWQMRGTVQLVMPFTKQLGFTVGFIDDYLDNAPNARKNYSTTSAGLSFSLGQN